MAFFEGNKMTGGYGDGPDIISSCTINVNKGEIVAILGPNGAGKSTAMKAMLGLLNLKSGTVKIDGKDISKLSPQDRVKQGISFVPQTRNVFTGLSVRENLEMGAFLRDEDLLSAYTTRFNLKVHELCEDKKNFQPIYNAIELSNHRKVELIKIPYWYLRIAAKQVLLRNIKLSRFLMTIRQFNEIFKIIENANSPTKFFIILESVINTLWYSLMGTLKNKK